MFLTLMEEPSGSTRAFWPLVSRSSVSSPSEIVYRNVSTPSPLPPDTYSPTALGPEFSSKYGVPSTSCDNGNNIVVLKMMKKKKKPKHDRERQQGAPNMQGVQKEEGELAHNSWCICEPSGCCQSVCLPPESKNAYHFNFMPYPDRT